MVIVYNFKWKIRARVAAKDGASVGETTTGMTFVPTAGLLLKGFVPGDIPATIQTVTYDKTKGCIIVELDDGHAVIPLADLKAKYGAAWSWQDEVKQ